jgi:hypothetical protein
MKKRTLVVFAGAVFAMFCLSAHAWADTVPVGYVSFDVTGTNVAEFDITNLTGVNSLPPIFPVTSTLDLTDLSITVNFPGNVSDTYGSSYFTLGPDGISWTGAQLSTLSGPPTGLAGAISATLTGMFVENAAQLNGANVWTVANPNFSATITDPSGFLLDGDLAVIDATVTPEPSTWLLLATGVLGVLFFAGAGRIKRRHIVKALPFACLLLLLPAVSRAQSAVTLSTTTTPGSAVSGGNVSVTGSGFPSGSITPADVSVTVAGTCGGGGTSATAILVTEVLGPVYKIELTLPGLSAGTYYVSLSGTTSTSNTFASTNCAKLVVTAGVSSTLTLTVNPESTSDWIINNGALTIDFNPTGGGIWSIVPTGTTDQLVDFDPGDGTFHGDVFDPADGESAIGGTTLPANWPGTSGIPGVPASFANVEPKGFYMDNSGAGTGGTGVGNYLLTDSYLDFWTDYSAASTGNVEYDIHYVVTPNDPGIHIYFAMKHLSGNGSTSVGQIQWIFRDNVFEFTNFFNEGADLSMSSPVITPLPSVDDCFSAVNGRNVEDQTGRDTIDLHPDLVAQNGFDKQTEVGGEYPNPNALLSEIIGDLPAYPSPIPGQVPVGFHRNFCVKYDYSSYEYLHPAHGLFGAKYGLWAVLTAGHDSFVFGPQKQNLDLTGGILTIEAESDHYQTGFSGISYASGAVLRPDLTGWTPTGTQTQTQAQLQTERIFGPFYVRINHVGMSTNSNIDGGVIQTPDDMYNDALAAGASATNFYNNETELLASGYIPTNARGSVSVQVNGVAGAPRTAWAVLSQPGVNHIFSDLTPQYVMDISATGSGTFTNVVPGTYRLSVYDFGKFGEYRNDSITVAANLTTTAPTITFQPESFGTLIGTIGTPDRSSHEFLHGAYTNNYGDEPLGFDDREYYGNWNYWADFASTSGVVTYNLNSGPNGAATNNPLAWNYAHWGAFNPALYGGAYSASDVSTDAYQTYPGHPGTVPAYVASLSGHTGTNGATTPLPPWQIHFATPASLGGAAYVDLTIGIAASQGGETVTLNGGTALSYSSPSADNSDAIERSGLSGVYQFVVFQFPISALKPAGQDNVITTKYASSSANSVVADDALRVELSVSGAQPSVTGWNDYQFIAASGAGTTTAVNDAVPNP